MMATGFQGDINCSTASLLARILQGIHLSVSLASKLMPTLANNFIALGNHTAHCWVGHTSILPPDSQLYCPRYHQLIADLTIGSLITGSLIISNTVAAIW